jgi:type IV pilus assembly protein PilC
LEATKTVPLYSYIAKSPKGETKKGVLEAKNQRELARILRREGFLLISADLAEKKRKKKLELPFSLGGVKLKEKMIFTRNLQVMVDAGVPLPRALDTLSGQTRNKKFKAVLDGIKEKIIKGRIFSEILTDYPNIFSELFVNMIKVGEETGNLNEVLKHLTYQMERECELKSKITGAMIYPAVIVCFMLAVGVLMLVMVVPQLSATFEELEIELPITTRIVIGIGDFVIQKWYFVILIILGLVFLIMAAKKTKEGKKIIDTLFLKLPIISSLIRKTNATYTVRNLGAMVASGVPIVKALEIISGTLGNIFFKEAINKAAEEVQEGSKLSIALSPYTDLYPPIVVQMIEIGEDTGQTSNVLTKLADFFEEEVTRTTKNLTSIIEPVLMILIGAVIGFFAVSMIQPMYSMIGSL